MKKQKWTKQNLGLTNNIFISKEKNQIKRCSNLKKNFFINYKNEQKIYYLLKNQKFSPNIIDSYFTKNKFILISEYLPETKTFNDLVINNNHIITISNTIKKLHAINYQEIEISKFYPKDFLLTIKHKIKNYINDVTIYENKINWLILNNISTLSLCHNDLTAGNFLFNNDNNLILIDYEYSCLNDYLFDIASFLSETLTNQYHQKLWVNLWSLTQQEKIRLKEWIYYQNILYSYWANYFYEQTKKPIYKTISNLKYNNILQFSNDWKWI